MSHLNINYIGKNVVSFQFPDWIICAGWSINIDRSAPTGPFSAGRWSTDQSNRPDKAKFRFQKYKHLFCNESLHLLNRSWNLKWMYWILYIYLSVFQIFWIVFFQKVISFWQLAHEPYFEPLFLFASNKLFRINFIYVFNFSLRKYQ